MTFITLSFVTSDTSIFYIFTPGCKITQYGSNNSSGYRKTNLLHYVSIYHKYDNKKQLKWQKINTNFKTNNIKYVFKLWNRIRLSTTENIFCNRVYPRRYTWYAAKGYTRYNYRTRCLQYHFDVQS